jgi:AbrB family looped-hinge helix DNA binding protein
LNPGLSESLYTQDMTQKIDQKGQVVVPKSIRDALSIGPGDEVVVSLSDGGALIQLVNTATSLKGTFAGSNMLEMLEQERAHEQK